MRCAVGGLLPSGMVERGAIRAVAGGPWARARFRGRARAAPAARLPEFLDHVTIPALAVGESRLDVLLRRYGSDVSVNVLRRDGDAQVTVTL